MGVRDFAVALLGAEPPFRFEAYDGTILGPSSAPATLVLRSSEGLRRIAQSPGELGFSRAFAAGDLDVEGDLLWFLESARHLARPRLSPGALTALLKELGVGVLRYVPPPPEEIKLRGRAHSVRRDGEAISHHYDLSNEFYRQVLGPSMGYSCGIFESGDESADVAQRNKYELVCRKLALDERDRVLDVGSGWGGFSIHAAARYGCSTVAVTSSRQQTEWASKQIADSGLGDRIEPRCSDWRDVDDGPYDAIASIGMFEHVGRGNAGTYLDQLFGLLRPGGRLLLHTMCRPPFKRPLIERPQFITRYVFPDGDLLQVGDTIDRVQDAGFEVVNVENYRNHYAQTLICWLRNLEANWEAAVDEVGRNRARIWRLYLAGCAVNFRAGNIYVVQILARRRCGDDNGSGYDVHWDGSPLSGS